VAGNWGVASVGRAGAGRHRVLFFGVWRGEHWAAEGHNNVAARRRALSQTRSHTQHRAPRQDKDASVTSSCSSDTLGRLGRRYPAGTPHAVDG